MNRPKAFVAILMFLTSISIAACATVETGPVAVQSYVPMPLGETTAAPPRGFRAFCRRLPAQCAPDAQEAASEAPMLMRVSTVGGAQADQARAPIQPTMITWSDHLWSQLNRVNREINTRIRPASDEAAFGVPDYWALPLTEGAGEAGNCKHYVLEKRQALLNLGIPSSALTMAVAQTMQGEIHLVLVVATSRGDYVLDNRTSQISPWNLAGYFWIERQHPGEPQRWVLMNQSDPLG